jgi:hypothetical protein
MTNPTSNFGWQMPENTDLVTNLPADFEVFGQAVDTDFVDLLGGTTGQVLSKTSGTDLDFTWVAQSAGMTNPMTTTGDTIYSSSGSTPARLGIGSAGQVLTVASGIPSWAAPAGGGKVLQVVFASTGTSVNNATTTYQATNLSASITPSSASSKVLVLVSQTYGKATNTSFLVDIGLFRDATQISVNAGLGYVEYTNVNPTANMSFNYLDAPSTTSSTTYTTKIRSSGTINVSANPFGADSPALITLLEIGA